MIRREFSGLSIPLLSLGCMRFPINPRNNRIDIEKTQQIVDFAMEHNINYFDTAYMYHGGESEVIIGKCLKKYKRDSYILVDKFPIWECNSEEDLERIFNEQLTRCDTEYFDIYLLHALNAGNFQRVQQLHAYEFILSKKRQGKIRKIGFSFHDSPEVLKEIVDTYRWDFAQIQHNYMDATLQRSNEQYKILTDAGIAVLVMEPVRGGGLAAFPEPVEDIFKGYNKDASIASYAIRWVASHDNVATVLSGMSNMEQIIDNTRTLSDFKPLAPEEYKLIDDALEMLVKIETIPCTACNYCNVCPQNIEIKEIFKIYNDFVKTKNGDCGKAEYSKIPDQNNASACIKCGICSNHCPQHIDISVIIEKVHDKLSNK